MAQSKQWSLNEAKDMATKLLALLTKLSTGKLVILFIVQLLNSFNT